MMTGSDLKAIYEVEHQQYQDNGASHPEYQTWLEKRVADLECEVTARGVILERIVSSAQYRGFEYNGWIDSLDYLCQLADERLNDADYALSIPPYEE